MLRKSGTSQKTKGFQILLILFIFTILVTSAMQAAMGEGSGKDPDGNGGDGDGAKGDLNQSQEKEQEKKQEGDCNQSQEKEQEKKQEGESNQSQEKEQEKKQEGECNQSQEKEQEKEQEKKQEGECNGSQEQNREQEQQQNGNCNQSQEQEQGGDCNGSQEQKREQEQEQKQQQNCTGNCTCDGNMYQYRWQNTQSYCFSKSSGNGGNGNGNGNQWRHQYQNEIQAGAENGTVVMETTFMKKERYMLQENNHYKLGMEIELLEVNGNRVRVRVSAEFQEGKVVAINIDENVLQFGKSGESNVYFDGEQINKGALEDVIAGEGTEAIYVGEAGDGGSQFLVYIPHFSEHIIEIESLLEHVKEELFTGTNFVVMGFGILTLIGLSGHVYKIGKSRT